MKKEENNVVFQEEQEITVEITSCSANVNGTFDIC